MGVSGYGQEPYAKVAAVHERQYDSQGCDLHPMDIVVGERCLCVGSAISLIATTVPLLLQLLAVLDKADAKADVQTKEAVPV